MLSSIVQYSMLCIYGMVLFTQWPFQDPRLEVPTIYKAYVRPMQGNMPTKYGLIWYSTFILGS